MKLYIIAYLMILVCGYATAIPNQTNTTASIESVVQDFESKAGEFANEANKFQNAGFESMSEKYQTLAKEYQVIVNICQTILLIQKEGGFLALLTQPAVAKVYLEEHKKLVDGYRKLISSHENIVIEIQSTDGDKNTVIRHREYSNQYKKKAAGFDEMLSKYPNLTEKISKSPDKLFFKSPDEAILALYKKLPEGHEFISEISEEVFSELPDEKKNIVETFAVTSKWIKTHNNVSKFLKTIQKARFIKKLDDLEKATVKRIMAYNNLGKLSKSQLRAKGRVTANMRRVLDRALDAIKKADRAYIEVFIQKEKKLLLLTGMIP